jgi:hypothetical protein
MTSSLELQRLSRRVLKGVSRQKREREELGEVGGRGEHQVGRRETGQRKEVEENRN